MADKNFLVVENGIVTNMIVLDPDVVDKANFNAVDESPVIWTDSNGLTTEVGIGWTKTATGYEPPEGFKIQGYSDSDIDALLDTL